MKMNKNLGHANHLTDGTRRKFLINSSRLVLLMLTIGFSGFLMARRRCRYDSGYDYSQQICKNCRQLNGCEKPPAENYRQNQQNEEARG